MKYLKSEKFLQNKFNHLLSALFLLFIFSPRLEVRDSHTNFPVGALIFCIVLFSALRATMSRGKLFWGLTTFIGIDLIVNITLFYLPKDSSMLEPLEYINTSVTVMFYLLAIYFLSLNLFRVRKVTPDTIKGAICAYFLIGFTWANIYGLLMKMNPASFLLTNVSDTNPEIIRSKMMYVHFSFTTLTTLGYGDIVPNTHFAAVVANLEAIVGQLFLTIFVARLVGLYIAEEMRKDPVDFTL